jgi:hypothetical protein
MCKECKDENKAFIDDQDVNKNQSLYCIHEYDKMKKIPYYELKNIYGYSINGQNKKKSC